MPAPRISSDLVNRVARGIEGTTATAVIKDTKRGIEVIVANGTQTVLPSPDEGEAARLSCDKAFGVRP